MPLPGDVIGDQAKGKLKDGVLTLTLPKLDSAKAQRKRIDIDDTRIQAGDFKYIEIIVNHFFLRGNEEHTHLIWIAFTFTEDLEIKIDITDVERNVLLGLELLADVSDEHDGYLAQASVGYRWKAMPELTVTPTVFLTYADDDYMDTYFGVNSGNRGSSTLPSYSADSGLKDVGINLVAHYTPWEQWGIMGMFSYKALLNDAKESPIVDDEGDDKQFMLGLMVTYRWSR